MTTNRRPKPSARKTMLTRAELEQRYYESAYEDGITFTGESFPDANDYELRQRLQELDE